MSLRLSIRALTVPATLALTLVAIPRGADAQVRPRFMIAFDTSGSMAVDLNDIPSYGDGVPGPTQGVDTNCDGLRNDSRIFVAKEALRDMVFAYGGDLELGLARFPQFPRQNMVCSGPTPSPTPAPEYIGITINNNECSAAGPFVSSIGDPSLNTGALISTTPGLRGNCGAQWEPDLGLDLPTDLIPAACRPVARLYDASSPNVCLNYLGGCPGDVFALSDGSATLPDGDILVGFPGSGWPATQDNTTGILKWIDNAESSFNNSTTQGNHCNHAGGGNCELRPQGPTPISGLLRSVSAYMTPIRTADTSASCRPYSVILITDGAPNCDGTAAASLTASVNAASTLRTAGINTYVIGVAIAAGSRTALNSIATAGGTDAGAVGGDTAYFANDRVTLAAGISEIVRRSLRVETCNNLDDNCNAIADEGLPKFCNTASGVAPPDCSNTAVNRPACTLCAPPAETACDGFDNNCNGVVDEGVRNACGTCGPTATEICDGLDNDCDGVIDEGGVCSGCVPSAEICDGLDNDCDGAVDESLTRVCGTEVGACTAGTQLCTAGSWGTCSGIGPTTETCNNVDDDCDGVVDGLVRACGSDVGACQAGAQICTGGAFGTCTGAVGPATELCNGLDDDCDGDTDEGNPGGGGTCGSALGECLPGTLACAGGMLVCSGGRSAAPESCNGRDDDCDGTSDEGVPTMGACGSTIGECRPGINTCVGGTFVCTGGRTATPEICDGRDNDCDTTTDEGNPGGGVSCGTDTGICARGTTLCVGGALTCSGGTGPDTELCNGLDDDCDGLVDEGNPGGGAACGDTTVGECDAGALACVGGALTCVGATGPSAERCDGLDNDCDGETDEGDPEGGAACGDDTGECTGGIRRCVTGMLVCEGGTGPSPEICNGLDDDCDGAVDEGLGVGAPCGSDVGECSPGVQVCRGGAITCEGQITPADEVCNALDDDCDGEVDEGIMVGTACGSDVGVCVAGVEQCVGGREVCVGEVPAGREACDCEDNDCDGATDEPPATGSLCPPGSECVECGCSRACEITEFGATCPSGRTPFMRGSECFCVEPRCDDAACATQTVEVGGSVRCAPGTDGVPVCACRNNACTFPCEGVVCTDGTVCQPETGLCVEDNCRGLGCPSGQVCNPATGACSVDPCESAMCASDEACRAGTCETSCSTVTCPAGQRCTRGACVEDRCADVRCPTGQRCDAATGACEADPCAGITCRTGEVCVDGACAADPCNELRCPGGAVCRDGECQRSGPPPDMGFDAGAVDLGRREDRVLASGGGGCACAVPGAPQGGRDGAGALAALLIGLGLFGARRVRRGARLSVRAGAVAGVAVAAIALGGAGCDVDPYCLTCGDDEEIDAGPIDLGPVDLGVDFAVPDLGVDLGPEDAGPDGCVPGAAERCNGLDDNCDGNVDEGIDVTSDPNNCGACGTRCEIPRAFAGCVASTCTLDECDVGFYDLDGNAANGCEYRCIPTETNDAVCDLRDNDCDGEIDEDVDFQTDPINCGACARTCRFARAVAGCAAGVCTLSGCDAGFFDLDGVSANGCEYACTPAEPAVETCNGRDDDCDGTVDEGDPGGGGTCGSDTGACATGTLRCTAGTLVCAGEVAPTTETCNGVDDDCDGDVDDGDPGAGAACGNGTGACERGREACIDGALVCTGGIGPVAELCNGIDDDCNGVIDDGNPGGGVACGPTAGACAAGMTQCVGGVVLCQGAVGPTDETCNGIDDDCDGDTDEGNPGGGSSCGTDVGECNPGIQQCMGGTLVCVGATAAEPETCNGLDDDCDAMIDDGVASAGTCGTDTGACAAGALACLGGTFQCVGAVGPALELCNGVDDDCDGATDEGFSLTSDPRNCGACGNVCAFANAIAGCSASACTLVACNTDFFNRDGLASNGCEYACDFNGAEVCNGRDDDCDGATDEGLTPPANFCNPNGVCAGTAATCSGTGGWVCNYPATFESTETRCDGLDNDCDGVANEGFPLLGTSCANGVGECRRTGTFVCNAAQTATVCNAPAAGTAATETCNNRDDNCDGAIDNAIPLASIPTVRVPRRTGAGFVNVMRYEASRADATASSAGTASRVACANADVQPWTTVTWTEASAACCALNASGTCSGGSGWRLCEADDWEGACEGPGFGTPTNYCTWSYGAGATCRTSSSVRCNGDEYDSAATAGDQDALFTTGSPTFPMCYTEWTASTAGRIFDLSGNVKEWTNTVPPASTGVHYIRGGSFNNVESGRTCQFDFPVAADNFAFPNTGFRCCFYE